MQGATTITGRLADGLYTEALLLADETRSYLDGFGSHDRGGLTADVRVVFACEGLNATTRLMQAIAALLAHKSGDPARGERLIEMPPSDPAEVALLPAEAQRLITAGQDLFVRVRRLDGSVVPSQPNPARALLHRLERVL